MEKQVSEGSLHKWFKGSKSKDGKGGWVNVVTGGTCASDEPGEGTPKCVSSAKRASMTKAERLSAARRKKKADPNQQQKSGAAKPTYVSTDKPKKKKMKETYERSLTPLTEKAKKCWPGYEKKGTKKMFGKTYNNCVKKEEVELEAYSANPAQQAAIAIAKKKKKEDDMVAMKKKKQKVYSEDKEMSELEMQKNAIKTGMMNGKKLTDKQIEGLKAGLTQGGNKIEEGLIEEGDKKGKGSGTKDACYHKVKSRYSVWPSAYASGALVKCRKVGAANWGNSSKKEEFSDWKSEFIWEDGDSSKKIEEGKIKSGVKGDGFLGPTIGGLGIPNPIRITKDVVDTVNRKQQSNVNTINQISPNSASMGKFKEFNKTVSPATTKLLGIKNSYEYEKSDKRSDLDEKMTDSEFRETEALMTRNALTGGKLLKNNKQAEKFGNKYATELNRRATPVGDGTQFKVDRGSEKNYGDNKITVNKKTVAKNFPNLKDHYDWRSDLDEDWQKTNRQDKTDGMSQKAVNAYRRENPGSKLKTAVTKKPSSLKRGSKDAKRRKSFCSRMKGMKKRLTSAKTARDPDSRINKALRRWNC